MAEVSRSHRAKQRRNRRRIVVTSAGIIVVVGGSAAAFAATAHQGSSLRTATARLGSVAQTVESSGTIASSQKAAASFSLTGSVKSIPVKVGSTVSKGQVLAQLDTTSLRSAVYADETTLATAKQKLEADKTGQTGAPTGNTGNSSGANGTPSAYNTQSAAGNQTATLTVETVDSRTTAPSQGTDLAGLIKQITAAQVPVINEQKHIDTTQTAIDTAQKQVNKDIVQNTTLSNAQHTACAGLNDPVAQSTTDPPSPTMSSSPSTSPTPTTSPTATPTTQPTGSPTPPVSAACTTAMANYEAFAPTLTTDTTTLSGLITTQDGYIQNLKTASKTLDELIGKLPAAAAGSGSSQSKGTGTGGSSGGSSQSGKNSTGGGSGQPRSGQPGEGNSSRSPSSGQSSNGSGSGNPNSGQSNREAQSGQGNTSGSSGQTGNSGRTGNSGPTATPASAEQLAADQSAIDAAQAALVVDQQNLTAATLTSPISGTVAAVGMTVGSSPSGQTITIVGRGIQQASIGVPLGQIDSVKVGQRATLTADGTAKKLHGTVRSVGLLSSTSGSSTTFPVTVDLDSDSPALFDGSGADVTISTATATNVLTIPNSAIHTTANGRHTVTVVDGNKTTTVPVTVGITGNAVSQITTGLKAGQRVVLADLSQQLPSSSTSSNTGNSRFPGGFGGGAFRVGAGGPVG